jgi:hypothetical protein
MHSPSGLKTSLTRKWVEAFSKSLVPVYRTTRYHIPEDRYYDARCEKLEI